MAKKQKTTLITGGAGFIGSNFAEQAVKRKEKVIILDALTYAGNIENLAGIEGKYEFAKGDICDVRLVFELLKKHNVDTIVNFAAESHVDNSITTSAIFIQTNITGTYALLEAARAYWLETGKDKFRFVQVSTDEVYGDLELDEDRRFDEKSNYAPNSPYSASKASADMLVRAWNKTYGLPTIITHCSNNYGPRQFPEKLIPLMISRALTGADMPVYGDGLNVRDWIHVEDHCRGIQLAIEKGIAGETYCFGGNAEIANIALVKTLCDIMDKINKKSDGASYSNQIAFVKDRPGHDRRYAIDSSLAEKELGFTRKYNFADGLKKTVKWYLDNEAWYDKVMARKEA